MQGHPCCSDARGRSVLEAVVILEEEHPPLLVCTHGHFVARIYIVRRCRWAQRVGVHCREWQDTRLMSGRCEGILAVPTREAEARWRLSSSS